MTTRVLKSHNMSNTSFVNLHQGFNFLYRSWVDRPIHLFIIQNLDNLQTIHFKRQGLINTLQCSAKEISSNSDFSSASRTSLQEIRCRQNDTIMSPK